MRRTVSAIAILWFFCFFLLPLPFSQAATISVDVDQVQGTVNTFLFGNAQPFGHGDLLLDFDTWTFQPEVLEWVSDLKPTILRFPGGLTADQYFWEDGIGPHDLRPQPRPGQFAYHSFDYGIDEHMAFCDIIGAEAFLTINYSSGLLGDSLSIEAPLSQRVNRAADWVEYCNTPVDASNPNGGVDWAACRAQNGYPEPYHIRFWEIGNEPGGSETVGCVDVETYAQDFLAFAQAMKAVDPHIQIGASGDIRPHGKTPWNNSPLEWNATLLEIAGEEIDFFIVHAHYPGNWNLPESQEELCKAGLAGAYQAQQDFIEIRNIIDGLVGSNVAIVAGENGFFAGAPEKWWLCSTLLAGLHLADLWMMFLNQSSILNISFACGWLMHSRTYNGDIVCDRSSQERFARPEYYAQVMFREHFGDILVANVVECSTFSNMEAAKVPARDDVPELSVCTSLDSSRDTLYIMVMNRQLEKDVAADVFVEKFQPDPEGRIWLLTGPHITASNEIDHDLVTIESFDIDSLSDYFSHSFPAHSLTEIELSQATEDSSVIDTLPPTISLLEVSNITDSSAQVSWQTNEPADSRIEYCCEGELPHDIFQLELTQEHLVDVIGLQPAKQYLFWVSSADSIGNLSDSYQGSFLTTSPRSAAEDHLSIGGLPSRYLLSQNFPNPFNAHTSICYQLPKNSLVTLQIYNTRGQLVRTLIHQEQLPGQYQVTWDGKDEDNGDAATGVYFCSLQAGDFRDVCKMTLLR